MFYGDGIDYAQVVDPELDDRAYSLDELKEALENLIDAIKSNKRLDDFEDLMGEAENWLDVVEDDIHQTENEIQHQLHSVSSRYCD